MKIPLTELWPKSCNFVVLIYFITSGWWYLLLKKLYFFITKYFFKAFLKLASIRGRKEKKKWCLVSSIDLMTQRKMCLEIITGTSHKLAVMPIFRACYKNKYSYIGKCMITPSAVFSAKCFCIYTEQQWNEPTTPKVISHCQCWIFIWNELTTWFFKPRCLKLHPSVHRFSLQRY